MQISAKRKAKREIKRRKNDTFMLLKWISDNQMTKF